MSIALAFYRFMQLDFESAVISSTTASFSQGCYFVELFSDGSYRLIWSENLGSLYSSPGLLLRVPPLSEDEYSDDFSICCFDSCRDSLINSYESTQ